MIHITKKALTAGLLPLFSILSFTHLNAQNPIRVPNCSQRYYGDEEINERLLAECEYLSVNEFEFSDGENRFEIEIVERWCPEATINTEEGDQRVGESSCLVFNWLNEVPVSVPLNKTLYDTVRDPDDPSVIVLIDMRDHVAINGVPVLRRAKTPDEVLESLGKIEQYFESNNHTIHREWVEMYTENSFDHTSRSSLGNSSFREEFSSYYTVAAHYQIEVNGYLIWYDAIFQVKP